MASPLLWLVAGCVLTLALSGGPARADDAKPHYERGLALFKAQKLDDARSEFELASKAAPNDPLPLSYLGLIALRQQRYNDAVAPLERAAQLRPDRADVHINLGNAYDRLKRYQDALNEFKAALARDANSASIYYDLGAVQFELKHLPEAIDAYRKAAVLDPKDSEIQNNLGYALQAKGDLPGAVAAYRRATQLAPENGAYQMNLGLALLAWCRKPMSADDRSHLESLWNQGRTALARAVQVAPNDYALRETYAELLSEMGRDADAQNQFRKAEELKPDDYRALYYLGVTQERLSNFHDAAKTLQRALAIAPDADKTHLLTLLGYAQVKERDVAGAVTTYEQLTTQSAPMDVSPDTLSAWSNLGAVLQEQKDLEAAKAQLDAAVQRGRGAAQLAPLHRAVGYLYLIRADADSLKLAHDAYTQANKEAPSSPDGYVGLGLTAQKQNQLDEARIAFQRAVELYGDAYKAQGASWDARTRGQYADAYNDLGSVFQLKGESGLAIVKYKMALQIDPNNVTAQQNLKRLTANASGR
jgi:tetratricopeptide (TPR) repeat protein